MRTECFIIEFAVKQTIVLILYLIVSVVDQFLIRNIISFYSINIYVVLVTFGKGCLTEKKKKRCKVTSYWEFDVATLEEV